MIDGVIDTIKRNKKGILIGLVVGFLFTLYLQSQGFDFMSIAPQSEGLIDRAAPADTTQESIVFWKFAISMMLIFSGISIMTGQVKQLL